MSLLNGTLHSNHGLTRIDRYLIHREPGFNDTQTRADRWSEIVSPPILKLLAFDIRSAEALVFILWHLYSAE